MNAGEQMCEKGCTMKFFWKTDANFNINYDTIIIVTLASIYWMFKNILQALFY